MFIDEDKNIDEKTIETIHIDPATGEEFNASEDWKNRRKGKKPHIIIHDYSATGSSETRNQEKTEEEDEK